jgi:hypothetical protein
VNPVHNAPVAPPPCRYLLRTGSNLSSCTVVVNAPRSYWPDVIQKKKDKKRSKYLALDFSEKTNPKKKKKKKQIRSLRFFCPFLIFYFLIQKNKSKRKKIKKEANKKKDKKKKQIRTRISLCGSFLGVAKSASQRPLTGRNALRRTD